MMASLMSSEMTREQKDELANKKMNEMRLKNEMLKKRHEEVEKDRLEAEKHDAAVTSSSTKPKSLPAKKYEEVNVFQNLPNHKPEREWDIGKGVDGDWSTEKEHSYSSYRNSRRGGGSDSRNFRKDSNWKPREEYNRRENNYQSYSSRHGGSFRGNQRYQDSGRGRQTNSHYDNSRQNPRTGPPKNWNMDTRKKYDRGSSQSNFNNQNSYSKVQPRYNDKIWHDDGMNEVQNKQVRVEKWVESLSSVESWTENDDKNVTVKRDASHNIYSSNKIEEEVTKPAHGKHKYADYAQNSSQRSTGKSYGDFHKSNYQTEHSNRKAPEVENKSFIERQTEMHMRGRQDKRKYSQGTSSYRSVKEDKPHDYNTRNPTRKYSGTWEDKERGHQKNKTGGTWSDEEEYPKPKNKSSENWDKQTHDAQHIKKHSGTWSDDEGNKKDSESWTDIDDSCENEISPSQNHNLKSKQFTKPQTFVDKNDKYCGKYENQQNAENHKSGNDGKTFGRSKSNHVTYDGGRVDKRNSGAKNSYDNRRSTDFNTHVRSQVDDRKHSKPSESWSVKKSDPPSKISGTWSDIDDDNQINKTSGAWSDIEDESHDNKKSSKNVDLKFHCAAKESVKQSKTSGAWGECPENKSVSMNLGSKSSGFEKESNNSSVKQHTVANIDLDKSRGSSNGNNFQKHESGFCSDQEFDHHNEDFSDSESINNNVIGRKVEISENKGIQIKIINQVNNSYEINVEKENTSNNNMEKEVNNISQNISPDEGSFSNKSDISIVSVDEIKNDGKESISIVKCSDSSTHSVDISSPEISQQVLSEDSAFMEQSFSENNESKNFENSPKEKICSGIEDATLSCSSFNDTGEKIDNAYNLPESKTDSSALSDLVERE